MSAARKGQYGLDAPYLLVLPVIVIVFDVWQAFVTRRPWPLIGGALIAFFCGFGWHSSRRGKFVVWRQILDDLKMRGDEQILDVGCGRGAVLLMAASHLTTGHATGIDLWRTQDQSGNAIEATRRNAQAEGVAGRVSLDTADMTALPFAAGSFDLILRASRFITSRARKSAIARLRRSSACCARAAEWPSRICDTSRGTANASRRSAWSTSPSAIWGGKCGGAAHGSRLNW
jgi:SAM-dependent methyltransferase